MLRLSQSTAALILGLGLLVAVDGWLRVAERTGYSLPPALGRPFLREALTQQAAVRDEMAAACDRSRRNEELARAVLHGELTLREGAARLLELYRAAPNFPWQNVARRFPGASEEECCCRLLIDQVRGLGGPDRGRAQALAVRLEAELDGGSSCGTPSPSA